MKNKIFKLCEDIRPVTVFGCALMGGVFFGEGMYLVSAVITLISILNAFYLKSK